MPRSPEQTRLQRGARKPSPHRRFESCSVNCIQALSSHEDAHSRRSKKLLQTASMLLLSSSTGPRAHYDTPPTPSRQPHPLVSSLNPALSSLRPPPSNLPPPSHCIATQKVKLPSLHHLSPSPLRPPPTGSSPFASSLHLCAVRRARPQPFDTSIPFMRAAPIRTRPPSHSTKSPPGVGPNKVRSPMNDHHNAPLRQTQGAESIYRYGLDTTGNCSHLTL